MNAPAVGLWGKLPARGDFVRLGLPRDFADGWDAWWQEVLVAAGQAAGAAWIEAWLEAPAWRFSLAPGVCGVAAVLGVFVPSVDRANRFYPLTVAAAGEVAWDEAFLDAAEAAARDAVAVDLAPEELLARLPMPGGGAGACDCIWRSEGGPRVAAASLTTTSLPATDEALAMIGIGSGLGSGDE